MIVELLIVAALTLTPFLELRASIPYGILRYPDIHWSLIFLVAVVTNMLLGPLVYLFMDKVVHLFLRIEWIAKIYHKVVERIQKKIHAAVEKYGEFGVAIFIGIPLPGSGSYSGAIGSYLIGLDFKKFVVANMIGVLIAAVIVTAVVLTGSEAFSIFVKGIGH